jgi:hypothetical protein
MRILFSILTLCPWVLAASLIYFLIRIARFYQKKYAELYDDSPRQRTYYQILTIPLFLFLVAAGRFAFFGDFVGAAEGDLAFLVGGILLAVLSYRLQQLMTGGRR